ncbi:MAG: CRISPR-associated endonuclease Cas2 [bacterium]|nr:CRISPR-associated endonuclease Cas2 [bacterium]MDZ4285583.1 CRISPR-associated endonuclease Cas2 [Candidatus Sungbacteria bacterium]
MNSSLRFAILRHINETGCVVLDGFFPKKYSRTGPMRWLLGLDRPAYASIDDAKRSISATLSFLKKEGFIKSKGARKKTVWTIEKKGRDYIKQCTKRPMNAVSIRPVSDGVQRLVIFDIPEKDRKQRVWLRKELLASGYSALQKSVYRGDCPLSEELLTEIYKRGIHKSLHIMSLDKLGTVDRRD